MSRPRIAGWVGVVVAVVCFLPRPSRVVEFADHLAVIEAAVGSAHGEQLVDVVQRRWPDKPIRWAPCSWLRKTPHGRG